MLEPAADVVAVNASAATVSKCPCGLNGKARLPLAPSVNAGEIAADAELKVIDVAIVPLMICIDKILSFFEATPVMMFEAVEPVAIVAKARLTATLTAST